MSCRQHLVRQAICILGPNHSHALQKLRSSVDLAEAAPSCDSTKRHIGLNYAQNTYYIDNYRGIRLLSLPGKVFAIVLKHKIQNWAKGLLLEGQCGFRKGRSCNDAIFSLNGLAELTHKTGNELHACFIDLSKAYDSVDRPLAWELFGSMGFPPKMLQLIKDLHTNTTCAMQADKDKQGSWFQVSTGFKQGDVNAPLFFNILLDSICRYIESKADELGFSLAYNIDGHLTGRRKPNGRMPCWTTWLSLRRTVNSCRQSLQRCIKPCRTGECK